MVEQATHVIRTRGLTDQEQQLGRFLIPAEVHVGNAHATGGDVKHAQECVLLSEKCF